MYQGYLIFYAEIVALINLTVQKASEFKFDFFIESLNLEHIYKLAVSEKCRPLVSIFTSE